MTGIVKHTITTVFVPWKAVDYTNFTRNKIEAFEVKGVFGCHLSDCYYIFSLDLVTNILKVSILVHNNPKLPIKRLIALA